MDDSKEEMTLEDQLLAERQNMWRRFSKGGFTVAFLILLLMAILGLVFYA